MSPKEASRRRREYRLVLVDARMRQGFRWFSGLKVTGPEVGSRASCFHHQAD
jgi:hypothetical protein